MNCIVYAEVCMRVHVAMFPASKQEMPFPHTAVPCVHWGPQTVTVDCMPLVNKRFIISTTAAVHRRSD